MDKLTTLEQLRQTATKMRSKLGNIVGTVAEAIQEVAEAIGDASNLTTGTLNKDRLADSGVAAGNYGPDGNKSPKMKESFTVPQVTVDSKGRVTGANNRTITLPDSSYTHPSYDEHGSGLYKVTVDSTGHVSAVADVTKDDITELGIPGQDTTYSEATAQKAGLQSANDKSKLDALKTAAQYDYEADDQDLAVKMLSVAMAHKMPVMQKGTVTLKNTAKYPFNNSVQTIALNDYPGTTNYVVLTQVEKKVGHMVGEIEVTDKALNGFKIAFTGSASSVTVGYVVLYMEWE